VNEGQLPGTKKKKEKSFEKRLEKKGTNERDVVIKSGSKRGKTGGAKKRKKKLPITQEIGRGKRVRRVNTLQ